VIDRTALKVFCVIILSFIIILTGCGNTKSKRKPLEVINSFETTASDVSIGDYDVETNGYVNLEQMKKYATKGKFSAKATFSVPVDFLSTTQAAKTTTWISSMTMSIKSLTPLKVTDWTGYKKFALDVYVPDQVVPDLFIKIVDASGKEYLAQRPLKNGRNKIEVLLDEVYTARLDLTNITSFSLYMDTKGQPKDIILYIDYIRLNP
jgi:hypothetical protein